MAARVQGDPVTKDAATRLPHGRVLADIGPIEQLRAGRLGVRLPLLLAGLFLYGASMAMVLRATLGQIPWDVLHVGVSHHIPLSFGTIVIVVGALVLYGLGRALGQDRLERVAAKVPLVTAPTAAVPRRAAAPEVNDASPEAHQIP